MHNLLPDYNAKVITNPQYLKYKDMTLQFLNAINSFFFITTNQNEVEGAICCFQTFFGVFL